MDDMGPLVYRGYDSGRRRARRGDLVGAVLAGEEREAHAEPGLPVRLDQRLVAADHVVLSVPVNLRLPPRLRPDDALLRVGLAPREFAPDPAVRPGAPHPTG